MEQVNADQQMMANPETANANLAQPNKDIEGLNGLPNAAQPGGPRQLGRNCS